MTRGESFRRIAPRFGVSDRALRRHAAEHVPDAIVKAHEAAEVARADDLLGLLREALEDARRLRAKAERAGDFRCAVAASRSLFDVVEKLVTVGERLARAESAKPPAREPVLTDEQVVGEIERIRERAEARKEIHHERPN